MAILSPEQWYNRFTCPWRLVARGATHYCMVTTPGHTVHCNLPGASLYDKAKRTWTAREAGAFREEPLAQGGSVTTSEQPEPAQPAPERYRLAVVDRCANQECSNRAREGRMATLTVFTTLGQVKPKRDVTLILCFPCAETLARVVG